MKKYVIEVYLSTTQKEKVVAGVLSAIVSAILILLLELLTITVPNPPFPKEKGELLLDFGLVEPSYGSPNDGGPSPIPPAKGGGDGSTANAPNTSNLTTGGVGDIVNTTDEASETSLPPLDPPVTTTPKANSRLTNLKIGKRSGSSGPGNPNGIEGGQGNVGFGGGQNTGGIRGNGGTRITKNTGNGFFSATGFANHQIASNVKKVDANGVGEIYARVEVPCSGVPRLVKILPKGNYTGTDANAKDVMKYFLSRSKFIKIENGQCPETGTIKLNVKKSL